MWPSLTARCNTSKIKLRRIRLMWLIGRHAVRGRWTYTGSWNHLWSKHSNRSRTQTLTETCFLSSRITAAVCLGSSCLPAQFTLCVQCAARNTLHFLKISWWIGKDTGVVSELNCKSKANENPDSLQAPMSFCWFGVYVTSQVALITWCRGKMTTCWTCSQLMLCNLQHNFRV